MCWLLVELACIWKRQTIHGIHEQIMLCIICTLYCMTLNKKNAMKKNKARHLKQGDEGKPPQ